MNDVHLVGGIGEMRFQSMRKMGKDFCPHFLQSLLENVDRRSCNDGSRRPTTLSSGGGSYLGVRRIKIQETRKYIECGDQIEP